jgi:hypothetical protein
MITVSHRAGLHCLDSGFDAFSSREPVSTPDQVRGRLSLENAPACSTDEFSDNDVGKQRRNVRLYSFLDRCCSIATQLNGTKYPSGARCARRRCFAREALAREADVDVNKITWAHAGHVTDPGRYMFRFGWLTITADDLAVWQTYPNAAFTLISAPPPAPVEGEEPLPGDEFRLGIFELPIDPGTSDHEQ